MTPSRKTLVLPLAGLLLVGAAGAAMAASSPSPSVGTGTVTPAVDPSPSAGTTTTPTDPGVPPDRGFLREDGILSDVLDSLVTDGTITADQQQAILDALTAERDARIAQARADADQLRSFLEDGVITQEEFDQLPADSRLRELAGIMDDGQITTDELRALGGAFGFGRGGHGFGHGFGPGGPGWDKDGDGNPDATPAPVPTPSPTTGS
jgi:hypothetical protein